MVNQELFPLESEQIKTKNINYILSQYTRYWYLFLIAGSLGLSIAYLYIRYYSVAHYNVYSTILIKDDKSGQGPPNIDAISDLSTFTTRNIDNEIQILLSKRLMTRVVTELGLFVKYSVEGKVRDTEIYGSAAPIKVSLSNVHGFNSIKGFTVQPMSNNTFELNDYTNHITIHHYGEQIQTLYGSFTVFSTAANKVFGKKIIVQFSSLNQVADDYNHSITITPVGKQTSILNISLKDPVGEKAKDIVNKLIEVYNKEAIEDKNQMSRNTLRFLDDRLEELTVGLSGVEKTVERFKSKNSLTDINTQASDYTSQASSYNNQLSEWAIQIDVLESIENYLRKNENNYSTVPSTLGIKDETLLSLIEKFNELQQERERLLRTTEQGNPIIQSLNEQLANLRINILENLHNIKNGLLITSSRLKANSGLFQSKIKRVPGMERELLEINRQQSIKQNIYSYLLQKREETTLSLAATTAIARVIDPATGGEYPIGPNKRTIYLMSLLLGLVVPFGGLYIANFLNNRVQSLYDVTDVTSIPIIGEIAHNTGEETVVVKDGTRSSIAEMFRLVRANLYFEAKGKDRMVVLVTSSMIGEGKTFFSINLAASLALAGRRVVLLDMDLRNPSVAEGLGLPNKIGIADYLLTDDITIDDIVLSSQKNPGLFVVPSGLVPQNPSELMMSAKFARLVEGLKANFDYIIMDTPPVGQVADAFVLAPVADLSIFVVRYDYTKKAQLTIAKNIYKNGMLNRLMIVLNDVREANGSDYGYGYGYKTQASKSK
jgi:tyrosine-protein kinase Etk/Wzc